MQDVQSEAETFEPHDGQIQLQKTTYLDRPFYYPADSMIGELIAKGRDWDKILQPILTEVLQAKPDPVIVEVGTNIGASLLQMEAAVPNAQFYCFEPANRFYPVAKKNIEARGWTNVKLENLFLSDEEGEVELNVNASTASAAISEYREKIRELEQVGSQTVPTTTMDMYFGEQRVDFIKIDTDGYEPKVVAGAQKVIKRHKPAIFMEFDPKLLRQTGNSPELLLNTIESLGYKHFLIFDNFGRALTVLTSIDEVIGFVEALPYYADVLMVHIENDPETKLETLCQKIGDSYSIEDAF